MQRSVQHTTRAASDPAGAATRRGAGRTGRSVVSGYYRGALGPSAPRRHSLPIGAAARFFLALRHSDKPAKRLHAILADLSLPAQDSVQAQPELFRRAAIESLTIRVLSKRDVHLRPSKLRTWASGATATPAWPIGALGEAGAPDDLLSLVPDPFRRCVVSQDDGEGDFDHAAETATSSSLRLCALATRDHRAAWRSSLRDWR